MGCFLGFAGSLLSRSCRSKGHKVSPLRLQRRDLRVSGLAVRPVDRSQNFYTSGQSGRSLSQDAGNKCFPVSRRLVSGGRDLPTGPKFPGHSLLGNAEGGLRAQRGKIRLGSVPISSVPGVFARLGPPPGVSVGGSDRSATATHSSCSVVSGETLEVVVWPPGQHDSAGPRGSTAHSSPPVLCAGEMGHVHAGVYPGVSDSGCPGDPSMVAPYSEPHVRGSFLGPGSGDDDRHRRFVLRVGRSPGRPDGFWHLATTREVETHQLARTSGGLAHAAAFPAAAGGHSGGGTVGQYDDSVLYQQAGRNSLSVAVQTSPGLVGVVRRAPDRHIGGASCGGKQHPGRCAVEGQLLPYGVDPPQVDVRVPVAGLGASVCGHVRLGEECPTPGILLPGSGSPGQRVERADYELGHGSRLRVPSDRTDPAGSEETSQTSVGNDRPTGTNLAQPDLVQTDDQSPGRSAQGDSGSVEPPEELGDTRVLPGAGATEVDCVEALRRSILAQGFSEKVADTAAKGHSESTRRVYGARASHFARWCAARAVDPYTVPVTEVADFLTDLSKMPHKGKPMAHSTIVGYRTAIASIHSGFEGGVSVSSHPVLSALMKGIYVDRAQVRTLRPTSDLPKVLEHLSKSPFEPMAKASLRDLSIKTAFLVQLASGGRGSWMHACKVDEGHLRKETGGWRLLPALLLDKNQGPGFTPSSVFLSSLKDLSPDDRLHCPVRALNWYISRTKEVRGNERFLFISSKEPHNRAAQSTIAGWVREAINSAYRHLSSKERRALGIRAHDTRGVAASWALLAGVPIQEIMDAAAWKTPVTFARHYLKDLPNLKGRFGRAIISTAGSSGGAKTTTA